MRLENKNSKRGNRNAESYFIGYNRSENYQAAAIQWSVEFCWKSIAAFFITAAAEENPSTYDLMTI
jgi:hypothetical protein